MSTWPSALHRHWFVVARADRVGGKPVAVTLLGRPLVLARRDGRRDDQLPGMVRQLAADSRRFPWQAS